MYKHLIERKDEQTFKTQVKPFLNVGEHYYKALLFNEDGFTINCIVGYGYRCSKQQFLSDLAKWAEDEIDGGADFLVFEKELLPDNTTHSIDSFVF